MRCHLILAAAVLCMILAPGADAQRQNLSTGDQAPSIEIAQWISGSETSIEPGNVYVIEFWATWCIPCRQAIPKLSRLQRQYADDGLVIIGVTDEEVGTVTRFVRERANQIDYKVAVDQRNQTRRAWMQAARRNTIPAAFIVDRRGRIQFIGSPNSDEFEDVLHQVIEDRFDARLYQRAQPAITAARNARRIRNWQQALQHLEEVVKLDSHVFALHTLERFEIMLLGLEDKERAYQYAASLLEEYSDDARFLIQLAEKITTDPNIDDSLRDLRFALRVADRAAAAGADNRSRVLATQALVHYHLGDVDQAVSLQRRAWMAASPERKPSFERTLRSYQEARQRETGARRR